MSSEYNQIIPDYELARERAFGGHFASIRGVFSSLPKVKSTNWKRTIKARIAYLKSSLGMKRYYRQYKSLVKVKDKSDLEAQSKYVIFYLHYQPERTSMPEAFIYAQQLLAINKLLEVFASRL